MVRQKSKVEKRNWIVLCIAVLVSLGATIGLTFTPLIDLKQIKELGNDFQYNLISTSATIGGFLFTGISILISTIANEKIERLWEHNYLNNVYRFAVVGIAANVVTILAALATVFLVLEERVQLLIIQAEISTVLVSLIFFICSVLDLVFILSRMKSND